MSDLLSSLPTEIIETIVLLSISPSDGLSSLEASSISSATHAVRGSCKVFCHAHDTINTSLVLSDGVKRAIKPKHQSADGNPAGEEDEEGDEESADPAPEDERLPPPDLKKELVPLWLRIRGRSRAGITSMVVDKKVPWKNVTCFLKAVPPAAKLDLRGLTLRGLQGKVNLAVVKDSLPNLSTLSLSGCKQIGQNASILGACSSLTKLDLSGCRELTSIYDISRCTPLRQIDLSNCRNLTSLNGITDCESMRHLNLSNCGALGSQAVLDLSSCTGLQHLDLFRIGSLHLGPLSRLISLKHLSLDFCADLNLSTISTCTGMEYLKVRSYDSLSHFSAICFMPGLKHLEIYAECIVNGNLSTLALCPHLTHLNLSGLKSENDLSALSHCSQLELLSLQSMDGVASLSFLFPSVSSMTSFTFQRCKSLVDISALKGAPLKTLVLYGDTSACQISDEGLWEVLNGATFLEHLTMHNLSSALPRLPNLSLLMIKKSQNTCFQSLSYSTALTRLALSHCAITSLGPLAACTLLEEVTLFYCKQLIDLDCLYALTNLKSLNVNFSNSLPPEYLLQIAACTSLAHLELMFLGLNIEDMPLTALSNLESVDLNNWSKLSDISALAFCRRLKLLDIRGTQVADLSPLSALRSLTKVKVNRALSYEARASGGPHVLKILRQH